MSMDRRNFVKSGAAFLFTAWAGNAHGQGMQSIAPSGGISAAENAEIDKAQEISAIVKSGLIALWYREKPQGAGVDVYPTYEKVEYISGCEPDIYGRFQNYFDEIEQAQKGRSLDGSHFTLSIHGPRPGTSSVYTKLKDFDYHSLRHDFMEGHAYRVERVLGLMRPKCRLAEGASAQYTV